MQLEPNVALVAALSCGIGYLMIVAGLSKSALELKRRHRVCPSCGRQIHALVCRACRG